MQNDSKLYKAVSVIIVKKSRLKQTKQQKRLNTVDTYKRWSHSVVEVQ